MAHITFPPPYIAPQNAAQSLRDAGYGVVVIDNLVTGGGGAPPPDDDIPF